ncbi:MAG: diguanylate cyclase [Sulfuricurvum sp. PC08-66]|nr:MAG: diguanylate cyclase [Sulfuricurvum sp. PC08-66]
MISNKKVLATVTGMLLVLAAATMVNVGLNFRGYAFKSAEEKAQMTASIVRDGLTAHMVNGIMDKRLDFLENVASAKSVKNLWVVRADIVSNQYGMGFTNETPRDDIDRQVLASGKEIQKVQESSEHATIRVTIPYIATAYGHPNCLNCHAAKEGDVLGAISMEFDIGDVRTKGTMALVKIFGINLLFIVIALFIVNRYTRPFMRLFEQIQASTDRAKTGDFSLKINGHTIPKEARGVAQNYNDLIERMDDTFGEVKNSLSSFVSRMDSDNKDPLAEANIIIHELADVYRFKKTIELDKEKKDIYGRIIKLMHDKFKIEHFALYEVNHVQKKRQLVHISNGEPFCSPMSVNNANECRAFRTKQDVYSEEFPNLCAECTRDDIGYICIPYQINDQYSLVLSISTKDEKEYQRLASLDAPIHNYLDVAKPVIETKLLMEILKDSSVKDGLTGLYNRRFLDEFIDKISAQSARQAQTYAVMMVDIDYFKMVNDTFGHDAGDIVIKRLSEVLRSTIRDADLAIRFGGEEFLLMLHNPSEEGAMQVAEKIRQSFAAITFDLAGEKINKTASIGVSLFPSDADSLWKVIKFADTALYKAKNSGRNQVVRFTAKDYTNDEF